MSKMRSLVALGLLALSALAVSTPAAAQDGATLNRVVANGELRVGMSGNQAPFNMMSRTGSLMGLEVDLANILAAAMQVELTIVTKPFGQLLAALDAGEVDMVISGVAITPERAQSAAFVGPYMLSGKSILTNSTALAAADSVDDINRRNLKLAALENSTSQAFIERWVPDAQFVPIQDYDAGVQMVLRIGRRTVRAIRERRNARLVFGKSSGSSHYDGDSMRLRRCVSVSWIIACHAACKSSCTSIASAWATGATAR